jgi:hypothetical protein
MGLITGLLGLPLSPVNGVIAAAEQIRQQAEEQFYDPASIRAAIEEVERQREAGVLSGDEAIALEDELIERLMVGRNAPMEG